MAPNFYDILGLKTYASLAEVRSSFKKLAVKYHPDKNPGDRQAEERFKEISNAYNVLGEEDTKREYDLRLMGMRGSAVNSARENQEQKRKKMREEMLRRRKAAAEQAIIDDWEKLSTGNTLKVRKAFNYALIATGVIFIFKNWFYTVNSVAPAYLIFGAVFIVAGNIRLQNINYTHWLYQELKLQKALNISRRVLRNLTVGIVLSIFVGIGVAHGIALIHFTFYSEVTDGIIVIRGREKPPFVYVYEVEGVQYMKELPQDYFKKAGSNENWRAVQVRYSRINPVFAKIIED